MDPKVEILVIIITFELFTLVTRSRLWITEPDL